MGPDGRGGVGLADGSGVWLATSGEAAAGAVGADSLQAEIRSSEITRRQKITELRRISKRLSFLIHKADNQTNPILINVRKFAGWEGWFTPADSLRSSPNVCFPFCAVPAMPSNLRFVINASGGKPPFPTCKSAVGGTQAQKVALRFRRCGRCPMRVPPDLDQIRCRPNKEQCENRSVDNLIQPEKELGDRDAKCNHALARL